MPLTLDLDTMDKSVMDSVSIGLASHFVTVKGAYSAARNAIDLGMPIVTSRKISADP